MPDPDGMPHNQGVEPRPRGTGWAKVRRIASPILHVVLPLIVVYLVWREFRTIHVRQVRDIVQGTHPGLILASIGAAAVAVASMGCYDVLAFPSGHRLPPRSRWVLSLLFFAWTNFLTLGPIGGPGLRLYFYSKRGLDAGQILRGLVRLYAGLFAGMVSWLGASLLPLGEGMLPLALRAACAVVAAPLVSGAVAGLIHYLKPGSDPPPHGRTLLILGLIGVVDWAAAFASFVLAGRAVGVDVPLNWQLRTVFVGHAAGVVSMVPGGLGAADVVWLRLLEMGGADESQAAAQILLFRVCFYVVPWLASFAILVTMILRRRGVARP
jgi:phosphatidylglycerol lysyltransferase